MARKKNAPVVDSEPIINEAETQVAAENAAALEEVNKEDNAVLETATEQKPLKVEPIKEEPVKAEPINPENVAAEADAEVKKAEDANAAVIAIDNFAQEQKIDNIESETPKVEPKPVPEKKEEGLGDPELDRLQKASETSFNDIVKMFEDQRQQTLEMREAERLEQEELRKQNARSAIFAGASEAASAIINLIGVSAGAKNQPIESSAKSWRDRADALRKERTARRDSYRSQLASLDQQVAALRQKKAERDLTNYRKAKSDASRAKFYDAKAAVTRAEAEYKRAKAEAEKNKKSAEAQLALAKAEKVLSDARAKSLEAEGRYLNSLGNAGYYPSQQGTMLNEAKTEIKTEQEKSMASTWGSNK